MMGVRSPRLRCGLWHRPAQAVLLPLGADDVPLSEDIVDLGYGEVDTALPLQKGQKPFCFNPFQPEVDRLPVLPKPLCDAALRHPLLTTVPRPV